MAQRRFVVLDRDGTIIVERHYLSDPRQVELIEGVGAGLRELSAMGLGLALVTNQSAVGRGLFDQARLDLIHQRLVELLEAEGIRLDGLYCCPHTPEDDCQCRKPRPGLIELAAKELHFNPRTSFVVGDNVSDIELGHRVGATTFLVRTGYGAQVDDNAVVASDYVVNSLWDAVPLIERLLAESERLVADATEH